MESKKEEGGQKVRGLNVVLVVETFPRLSLQK